MGKKENRFWQEKTLENIRKGSSSLFLDPLEFKRIKNSLKKEKFSIWEPFCDSDYKIIYKKEEPNVICFKIECTSKLTHPMIMGSLYALNIESSYIGDIVVESDYYFFVISTLKEYIKHHLTKIGKYHIQLIELPSDILKDYERSYEKIEVLVPSLRLDVILSKLGHTSRRMIKEKVMNEEVTLNYEIVKNGAVEIHEMDIFSMRKYGKFKFIGVKDTTKRGNLIIVLCRYK